MNSKICADLRSSELILISLCAVAASNDALQCLLHILHTRVMLQWQ
jgi:hypothetical protein